MKNCDRYFLSLIKCRVELSLDQIHDNERHVSVFLELK